MSKITWFSIPFAKVHILFGSCKKLGQSCQYFKDRMDFRIHMQKYTFFLEYANN